MNKYFLFFFALFGALFSYAFLIHSTDTAKDNDKVLDILVKLGDKKPLHYKAYAELSKEKIQQGYEIVTTGITTDANGNTIKKQSKHFVCTDCHNIAIEDPDLTKSDPEARLAYASQNNLKFLPGTTMAGVVNREHWYNGDYIKKYGDLVTPAYDTLTNAIQLCATQCSQGRLLNDWEMDVVIEYFLSIGHEIKDLNLSTDERKLITVALNKGLNKEEAIEIIKSKYLNYSPATFMQPQPKKERKLGASGNAKNGEKIYELSCLTCHQEMGVTNYKLDTTSITFNHLEYWSDKDSHYSVYNITRKGTYAKNGYKPYMPNYTKERLSDKQLEDLMAYIKSQTN